MYNSSENSITISNTAPAISFVQINSTNPSTNDTLQNITSHILSPSDADNDNISYAYRWYNTTGIIAESVHFNNSLVLYMPFDNDARDYALSNDGTVTGATLNKTDFKVGSGAFSFDGNDFINTTFKSSAILGNDVSVSGWVKIDGTTGIDQDIVGEGSTPKYPYLLRYQDSSSKFHFALYDGTNAPAVLSNTVILGKWYHLVGIRDTATDRIYLYVDGVLNSNTTDTTTGDLRSGRNTVFGRRATSTFYMKGVLDEVAIWNRSLSAAEIQQLYYAGIGKDGTELLSNFSKKNDNITVEVTPIDYLDWGTAVNSSLITILDT